MEELAHRLYQIDGRGYGAYKSIRGAYPWRQGELHIEHVQGDPFAAPSRLRVDVPAPVLGLSPWVLEKESRRVGAADRILRRFVTSLSRASAREGSGKSGQLSVAAPGQVMLRRSACELNQRGDLCLRFYVGLPAAGRRVLGRKASTLLCERVPRAVDETIAGLDEDKQLVAHAEAAEDQWALRDQLKTKGLVAFIADGACLPRLSGDRDTPMPLSDATAWSGPPSLKVSLSAPHAGVVTGTGIPKGITLICGGGYHGKSTVLKALARGIYDHIPGDGRELVVSDPSTVTIRAEDGRCVAGVDISPFIDGLPGQRSTRRFYTSNASGSTSQAAAVVEALELGAGVLLLDEDTCATNFMIRDRRMQSLVSSEHEPITPFLDRVCAMREGYGTDVILVMGGSGDYFDVADTVLMMTGYRPLDVSDRAMEIAKDYPTGRVPEGGGSFPALAPRAPRPGSFDPSRGKRAVKVRGRATRAIEFGRATIEIDALEQLVDPGQTRTIADAMVYALEQGLIDGRRGMRAIVEALEAQLNAQGPGALGAFVEGDRVAVRAFEIGAAINRLRSLEICESSEA